MTYYSGYRWATGTLTSAGLTITYAIEDFARQSDMKSSWAWTRPQSRADILLPALQSEALDASVADYGGTELLWEFPFWTSMQVNYVFVNLFGSVKYADQTIRVWDRQFNTWRVLNVRGIWPSPETIKGLENRGGGFVNFPIRFILGTAAA